MVTLKDAKVLEGKMNGATDKLMGVTSWAILVVMLNVLLIQWLLWYLSRTRDKNSSQNLWRKNITIVAHPKPLQLTDDVKIFVVTKENFDEFKKEFTANIW